VIAKKAAENAWPTRFRRGGDWRPAVWRANPAGPTHPILAPGSAGAYWRDKALARAPAGTMTASIRRIPRTASVRLLGPAAVMIKRGNIHVFLRSMSSICGQVAIVSRWRP
jgi:hypothetical protein